MIDFENLGCFGGCGSGWGFFLVLGVVGVITIILFLIYIIIESAESSFGRPGLS